MTTFLRWLAPSVALSLSLGAFAQQPPDAPAGTPSPQLSYRSAFSDYKPWTDIKAGDWRQLNDNLSKPSSGPRHGDGAAPASNAHGQMPAHAMPMPMNKGHQGHQGHQMPGAKP